MLAHGLSKSGSVAGDGVKKLGIDIVAGLAQALESKLDINAVVGLGKFFAVLAGLAGQVLFVVEAVRTTQSAVREALHMIETHPNIGLVLNKSRERPRGAYQYGYYGADY